MSGALACASTAADRQQQQQQQQQQQHNPMHVYVIKCIQEEQSDAQTAAPEQAAAQVAAV